MDDIIIRLIKLPHSIRAYVSEDSEGDYNIYLNDRFTNEANIKSCRHEMRHIKGGHFQDERYVRDLESEM
jgi:predicted ABC-type ATPase